MQLLTPHSWLFFCDLVAACHHCRVAPQHRKYTGFHLALPARGPQGDLIPLQHVGYYDFASDLQPQQLVSVQAALSAHRSSGGSQPQRSGMQSGRSATLCSGTPQQHANARATNFGSLSQRQQWEPSAARNFGSLSHRSCQQRGTSAARTRHALRPSDSELATHAATNREEPLYQVVELCACALNFGARASPLVFTKTFSICARLRLGGGRTRRFPSPLEFRDFIEKPDLFSGTTFHSKY